MAYSKHTVFLGPKFTQANFDAMVWENNTNHYQLSFAEATNEVVFDLSILEWIGTEQIAFLFAWIRNIKLSGKKITVILPYRAHLQKSGYYKEAFMQVLKQKYSDPADGEYVETELRVNRRKTRNIYLLSVWGIMSNTGLQMTDMENMADFGTYNKEDERINQNSHQVIPFSYFDVSFNHRHIKFDTYFNELINSGEGSGLFNLQQDMQDILKHYASYSPFESKILSNVITQELFINSLQHSFGFGQPASVKECYVAAFLSNRWDNPGSRFFNASFLAEKYPESLDFYKDKNRIAKEIGELLQSPKYKNTASRTAALHNYDYFKNSSYLEYTFLDFGSGISDSLRVTFKEAAEQPDFRKRHAFSTGFDQAGEDGQILEYAFLLETSRNPLDKTIEFYDLVPRGLFFLVDMVRRYNAMLIVRSGDGRLLFDFSEQVVVHNRGGHAAASVAPRPTIREAIKHIRQTAIGGFKGTMVTIVIPEKRRTPWNKPAKDNTIIPAVRQDSELLADYAYSLSVNDILKQERATEKFKENTFHYIGLLFLYNEVVEEMRGLLEEVNVQEVYNRLFAKLNRQLDDFQEKPCILFFDFAGLRAGNAPWMKIIYYLFLTPKINEVTKAIIVNLPPDEGDVIRDLKRNYYQLDVAGEIVAHRFPDPYLYRPIPCLSFRIEAENEEQLISWIGLKEESDADLFSRLLIYGESANIEKSKLEQKGEGNILVKNDGWMSAVCIGIQDIADVFYKVRAEALVIFLQGFIEHGINPVNGEVSHIYQVSNNGYQFSYLSLYEVLHDKSLARYFGKCLLDKYCSYVKKEVDNGGLIDNFKLDKIIAVTVSSQMISVAIRDLIEEDDNYAFLRNNLVSSGQNDRAPDLIMLSSYYSFDTEKPFERIELLDKILIVNDVISTGKLVEKLIDKIENGKNAIINAVFSIADTRVSDENKVDKEGEMDAVSFGDYESLCFTLADFDDGIRLHKYKGSYRVADGSPPVARKRINPLLNTVVGLKATHSEQHKILFDDPGNIIRDPKIGTKYFKIGHFQQNLAHIGYLTAMRHLFSSGDGLYIMKKIHTAVGEKAAKAADQPLAAALGALDAALKGLPAQDLTALNLSVDHLKLELKLAGLNTSPAAKSKYDFIFFPVFSGLEKISHFELGKVFDVQPDNIIGLQRFDTPKGWRFPFPAKRYNQLTKNKDVLILDSGSLTGESLVQLIDNVAFLDVNSITVISVITRIEDFYREFYSRLRAIKVKRLKPRLPGLAVNHHEKKVPINVLFGINLHIPVYPLNSCPFCAEINYLDSLSLTHSHEPSDAIKKYINVRKQELFPLHAAKDELLNASYLPKNREDEEVDTKAIFLIRDVIGKIDSYRFYPDYFEAFKELLDLVFSVKKWYDLANVKKDIECILACILHEPYLFELIDNLFNEISPFLKFYLWEMVNNNAFSTYYVWEKKSVVTLTMLLNAREIFELSNFEALICFCDKESFLFLQFRFWDMLYKRATSSILKTQVEELLMAFDARIKTNAQLNSEGAEGFKQIMSMLTDYYNFKNLSSEETLIVPCYNLKKFVLNGEYRARHFLLKEYLNKLIVSLISMRPDLADIREELTDVLTIFRMDIVPNVKLIRDVHLKKYYQIIFDLLGDETGGILFYFNELEKISKVLARHSQAELDKIAKELKSAKDLCVELVTKILIEDSEENTFFKICQQYPCVFLPILEDQRKKRPFVKLTVNNNLRQKHATMAINSAIFKGIIEEIFNNAGRLCSLEKLEITVKCDIEETGIFFRIAQNLPYIEKTNDGGLSNNVRHFVHKFGGRYEDNSEESLAASIPFIINITLMHHEYKN
jgi:hypoxanthine-guanine phosphoribosyltransferase